MPSTPPTGRRVFATLPWKGALLLDVRVDRRGAPHFDEVTLTLTGPGRWVCVGNLSLGFPQPQEPGDDDQSGSAAP